MQSLSQLPTDNLYKLIALAGCGLVLFALWLYFAQLDTMISRLEDAQLDLARWTGNHAVANLSQGPDSDPELAAAVNEATIAVHRQQATVEATVKILHRRESRLRFLSAMCSLLIGVGFALSAVGFSLWYVKLQSPQDELIASQLRDAKSVLAPSSPPVSQPEVRAR